jgi:hypothetical protein
MRFVAVMLIRLVCNAAQEWHPASDGEWQEKSTVAQTSPLTGVLFLPILIWFFALSSPTDHTFSGVVKRLSERVQHDSRIDDRTFFRIVIGIFDALAAKPPIPSIHCALLEGRKDAVDASRVSYDAPWIVYICLHFSRGDKHRR